eukprot:11684587-Ditylum_brightwellii.AAC.1
MGRSGAGCGCSGTLCAGSGCSSKVLADAVFDDGVSLFVDGCLVLYAKRVDFRKRNFREDVEREQDAIAK